MGSSAKRKKEKQKDFQVRSNDWQSQIYDKLIPAETQTQGRQGQGKAGELYRHQFQGKRYAVALFPGILGSQLYKPVFIFMR